MKKTFIYLAISIALFASIFTVSAWAVAHFDSEGKEYTQYNTMTGNFYHGIFALQKNTEPVMYIDIVSYKPGLLGIGWSKLETTYGRLGYGTGILNEERVALVNNSGTKEIKTVWTQTSAGSATADLIVRK